MSGVAKENQPQTDLRSDVKGRSVSPAEREWQEKVLKPALEHSLERQTAFTTPSGVPIGSLYTPADVPDFDYGCELGDPGKFPFTRGIHATMYRGKVWTMRQFSGFGTPQETNQRLRYLLDQGQTGLSIAFDLPTLMGYDSDHPLAEGEAGKCGVAVSSLEDMEALLQGIPLERVSVSMTINSPAAILWAMYLVAAEKSGADWKRISGTLQNDILKEYIAQKEYIFPPSPSMRLVADTIAFAVRETPRWHPISISGYHIREAGSTAVQELAFTLRAGVEYAEWALRAGFGRESCGSDLGLEIRAPWRAGSTFKRQAARSLRNNPTTMWCEQPFRRWPRCSAARSPCTRMRLTRRGPCLPKAQRGLPCARSRCLRTRAA